MSNLAARLAGWQEPAVHLRQALAKDELTLFCQPIASLNGGPGFPMAEVLVRLRQEEAALMPPGEFLPVFEQHGLMPELDRWVLRHTLRHIAAGSRIQRFSINISGQSLADVTFPGAVAMELIATGVSGGSILFEIDEADSIARLPVAERFARGVRAVGCGLMLDGFGRASTSFAALKALKVDFVKVDGSIVRKLLASPEAETKLRAMQKIGESLGFKLVAEMVEDQDILTRLKALGVAFAQGFGICEPHPIGTISAGTSG